MRGTDARGEGTPTKEQDANFPSLLDKLRYKVDYFLSAKKYARFLALFGISFLLVTFCALLADLVVPDPSFHFGEAMWWSMVRVIDTGSLETSSFASSSLLARTEGEDEETTGHYDGAAVRAVSVFTTLCGLAVVASLIGLVNTTIEERFEELRRGKSRVIDKDHTLILGFDREKLLVILEELRQLNWNEANADKKNKKNRKLGRSVVILSEQDKLEVEAMVHENLPDLLNTSVVVRQGSPHYPRDLIKVGADRARCTIILADKEEHRLQVERGVKGLSDMSAIKTLLALRRVDVGGTSGGCGSPLRNSQAIVIELKDERRRAVIERLGRGKVIVVNTQLTLSRILVQTSRQRGLAKIYAELLTYVGSEFYFRNFPELEGRKFGELQERVQGAVVLGLQRRGKRVENKRGKADEHTFEYKTVLNPSDEFVLEKGDEVLVLAECGGAFDLRPFNEEELESNGDDETTSLLQQNERKDEKEEENEEVKQKQKDKEEEERQHAHPETFLICGYAKKLPTVLHEFANYVPHGSRIYLMPGSSIADRDDEMVADIDAMSFPNLSIHWVQGDPTVPTPLREIVEQLFFDLKCAIVLADDTIDEQEADAHTIITVLLLSEIFEDLFTSAFNQEQQVFTLSNNRSNNKANNSNSKTMLGTFQKRRRKRKPRIISEILDPRSEDLLSGDNGAEFVLSTLIISRLLTQISEQPGLCQVFAELFAEEGNEIYLLPAPKYCCSSSSSSTTFTSSWKNIQKVARERRQLAIGFMRSGDCQPVINPTTALGGDEEVVLGEHDKIVVLSEDEFC